MSTDHVRIHDKSHSLIAPVEPHGDVALDLAGLVLGEVTLDQLPPQVDELVHHMSQLVEQIHLVFLFPPQKNNNTRVRCATV